MHACYLRAHSLDLLCRLRLLSSRLVFLGPLLVSLLLLSFSLLLSILGSLLKKEKDQYERIACMSALITHFSLDVFAYMHDLSAPVKRDPADADGFGGSGGG
jgi:hypothetical protein